MNDFSFDKQTVTFGALHEESGDRDYWMARSAEERLAGVEFLRRQFYAYASAESELRRFLEVAERPGS